jgi:N-glycosylase/DNA lyase
MPGPPWSDWQPLVIEAPPTDAYVLTELLDGGQTFRWFRQWDGAWRGTWGGCVAEVRLTDSGLQWRSPAPLQGTVGREIERYFGGDRHLVALIDELPWRGDRHLALCLESFPGLRILRQPFGETLLGFLCSATKQIVQIKQMLTLLGARHGAPLLAASKQQMLRVGQKPLADPAAGLLSNLPLHHLPTWAELATVPESALRVCLLGFRARFIHETAIFLAANPGWLEATEQMPYSDAKARLCSLPGVGDKIADCTLLFGAGRLEAFPVDVWILRAMEKRYGLQGWNPEQVAQFGRAHFGALAGLAQQYIFAFERRQTGQ